MPADIQESFAGLPDRYQVLSVLGEGGMARVHRVLDQKFDSPAALKVLRPKHAISPEQRQRFHREAWLTARLQHPAIVPPYDAGVLDDGRPWFLMKEIRGQRLREHMPAPDEAARAWSARDIAPLLERLERLLPICDAVAYAHSIGILHRDIKPENVMIGEFSEVYVLDWGIARWLRSDRFLPTSNEDSAAGALLATRHGRVMGTPPYMALEQAEAQRDRIGPWTDVYALGAVMYELLTGTPLYTGGPREMWLQVQAGPPEPLAARLPPGALPPDALVALVEQSIARPPEERFQNAGDLAAALRNWLETARKEADAREVLDEGVVIQRGLQILLQRAEEMEQKAETILEPLAPHDPSALKAPAWLLQDQAAALRRQAELETARYEQQLQSALQIAPDFEVARRRLAAFYQSRAVQAEARRDLDALAYNEQRLRTYDRGEFASWLQGDGRLTLRTEPPGAEVTLRTWREVGRRLIPGPPVSLGQTPLEGAPIARGSHLLEIRAPDGGAPTRYPIFIRRSANWDGAAPGEDAPHPIRLPRPDELGPDEILVPAGWFQFGGDPEATDGLPARQIWVDGFVVQRHPVTIEQYLVFLNALVAAGEDALRYAPHEGRSVSGVERCLFRRDGDGRFVLDPGEGLTRQEPDWPVNKINWESARAYARWWAAETDRPWRLPEDLEWEKAARGVDGRLWPWGNHPEPTWANTPQARATRPCRTPITAFPTDEGPYGVRGMAGNVRDWCNTGYRRRGPPAEQRRVEVARCDDEPYRIGRGGSWSSVTNHCRPAARLVGRPTDRLAALGFRLVYSW